MITIVRFFGLLAFFALLQAPIKAQDTEELLDMSLEDLMKIEVVTASKEAQSIEDAPAVIDVITENQIRNFNANNLYELLSLLPGIEAVETSYGRTVLNVRGVLNYHYSNKVLLLINGKPVFEPVTGSFLLEIVPINSITQIEVIRGPGSSLYGTNAYSGVINIITKNGIGDNAGGVSAYYGTNNQTNLQIDGRYKISDKFGIYAAADMTFSDDGYKFQVPADEKGIAGEKDYYNKPIKLYLNTVYENFGLNLGYLKHNKSLLGVIPVLADSAKEQNYDVLYGDITYNLSITDNLSNTSLIRYNYTKNNSVDHGYFPVKKFGGHAVSTLHTEFATSVFGFETQFALRINDKLSNMTGFVYEASNSDPYKWIWDDDGTEHPLSAYKAAKSSYNIAGFTQFTYKPLVNLTLLAGLRAVKDKDVKDMFLLPRAGLIYKLSDEISFKALYGEAFRSPTFFEKYVENYNLLYGSVALNPERIKTIDVALEATIPSFAKARLNGFMEFISDGIERKPTQDTAKHGKNANVYVNNTKQKIYGIEFSLNGALSQKTFWGINFSYEKGTSDDGKDIDLLGFAELNLNAYISYNLFDKLQISPTFQYTGAREGISNRIVDGNIVGKYKIDPYLLVNLNVNYDITNNIKVFISLKNLLNTEYYYPEYVRSRTENIPGWNAFNFIAGIKYYL